MKIEHYISQLLYRYQCVTVPGFGAFLTETQSAQLQENSNSFYPPKKLVSFNSYIKSNDGLLANHIAQSEKMLYEVALSVIENQVIEWKNSLQSLGKISLKNIGEIALNAEKSLVFTPNDQLNYLKESFGLTSFISPAVKREVYTQEIETVVAEEKVIPITTAATIESRNNTNVLLKYAAIFVLGAGLLGTGGYFGDKFYQNKIQEETLAVNVKVQNQVNKKIQEATFLIENPMPAVTLNASSEKETMASSVVTKMPYHIMAGSFKSEENATKLYQSLLKAGFKAKLLPVNERGWIPVAYGSYSDYKEAQNQMNQIKEERDSKAWILVKEL